VNEQEGENFREIIVFDRSMTELAPRLVGIIDMGGDDADLALDDDFARRADAVDDVAAAVLIGRRGNFVAHGLLGWQNQRRRVLYSCIT